MCKRNGADGGKHVTVVSFIDASQMRPGDRV